MCEMPVLPQESAQSPAPKPNRRCNPSFGARQWMLLGLCLILAGALCLSDEIVRLPLIQLCALALGLLAMGRVRRPTPSEIFLMAASAALSVLNLLYRDAFLFAVNQFAIPALSATALFSLAGIGESETLSCRAFGRVLAESIPGLFRYAHLPILALLRIRRAKDGASMRVVLLSLLVCLPILGVVIALLADADPVFSAMLGDALLKNVSNWTTMFRAALTVVVAMMLSSWYTVLRAPKRDRAAAKSLNVPAAFPAILLPMLNGVYALFVYIQFANLFGGATHAAMAGGYAQYARSGFFQLALVSALNLMVLAVAIRASRGAWIRTMSALLIAATAVVLASAFWRMRLYIEAFGLTVLRALTLWGMLAIAVLIVIATVALFVRRFRAMPVALICLISLWVGLNAIDLDARIANYNVDVYLSGELEAIDEAYLRSLSGGESALERLE